MTGRPGRRRRDSNSPLVDLEVVFADDEMVDAIAASVWGSPVPHDELAARARRTGTAGQPGRSILAIPEQGRARLRSDDPLPELFGLWRHELAAVPMPAPPPIRRAVPPKARVSRGRALRPALSIAAAIAMLLAGSATVGAKTAEPEDVLWPITVMVWPDRAQSVQSVAEVRAALAEARSAIDEGRPEDAQLALLRAAVQLGNVDDVDGRADMELAVTDLWAASAPAGRVAAAQIRQVGGPDPAAPSTPSGPSAGPFAPVSGAVVGATTVPPAMLGALVPAAPVAVDGNADRGPITAGGGVAGGSGSGTAGAPAVPGNGTAGNGTAGSGTTDDGVAGSGSAGVSSGSGSSPVSGASAGSDQSGNAPAVVAIPTPPVSVSTPTEAPPVASATEQSPPTPSQTTDPTQAGGDSGGKTPDGNPVIGDGVDSVSTDSSSTSAEGSAASVESTAGVG